MCVWIHAYYLLPTFYFVFLHLHSLFLLSSKCLPVLFYANNHSGRQCFCLTSHALPLLGLPRGWCIDSAWCNLHHLPYQDTDAGLGVSEQETRPQQGTNHIHTHKHVHKFASVNIHLLPTTLKIHREVFYRFWQSVINQKLINSQSAFKLRFTLYAINCRSYSGSKHPPLVSLFIF